MHRQWRRILALGLALAAPSLLAAAAWCPGEELAREWVRADFEQEGGPQFRAAAGEGGSVARIEFPAGSGNQAVQLTETNGGRVANGGSSFVLDLSGQTAFLARLNEVLAQPLDAPPVHFLVSLKVARLQAASRIVAVGLGARWWGPAAPAERPFVGETRFERLAGYRAGQGFLVLDNVLLPPLRLRVFPSAGKQRLAGFELSVGLRVEGDSTPEAVAIDDVRIQELRGSSWPAAPAGSLAFAGDSPPNAFLQAAARLNWQVLPAAAHGHREATVLVINRRLDAELARDGAALLAAGKGLILGNCAGPMPEELAARLPVNFWSLRQDNLTRYDAHLAVAPGSALAGLGPLGPLAVANRWDLHLPFAPIENALHRYLWREYEKDLRHTAWQVQATAAVDGDLPVLVSGRSGPGRALVFAADFADPLLLASPGYPALAEGLLRLAAPPPATAAAVPLPAGEPRLELSIPPHQTGDLRVTVANRGGTAVAGLLSYKLSNWSRELRQADALPLHLGAGETAVFTLPDRHPETGDAAIPASADRALPWRRLRVGVVSPDLARTWVEQEAVVATAPALSLGFEEDPAIYADMQDWPRVTRPVDGRLAYRYVYRTGMAPRVQVRLSNGLLNLAPLARAGDRRVPANWSAAGLNDLSYTPASGRGKVPIQGGWTGRSATEQEVALDWPLPVTVASCRLVGHGSYRHWNDGNPRQFTIRGDGPGGAPVSLAAQTQAQFAARPGDTLADCILPFAAPALVRSCVLHVSGLDPKRELELRHWFEQDKAVPGNCVLAEWEVYGWPGATPPPAAAGRLEIAAVDLRRGTRTLLFDQELQLAALQEFVANVAIPARQEFGPVRLDARFAAADGRVCRASFDVLFVPAAGEKLTNRSRAFDFETSLLCTPGWVAVDDFGKGIANQTGGWGGPDDKLWAYANNLMTCGSRGLDQPNRMLSSAIGATHYSTPWRAMPNGEYSWDCVARGILANVTAGKWRKPGLKTCHVFGSDAWNGVNAGGNWGWGEFIAFDQYLRQTRGSGLKGRSRRELSTEISRLYGDLWQTWQLSRYADSMLATRALFARAGLDFTFETHGSFPLAGGELGAKLAQTHCGVGTDLFWDLRRQDLFWTLGTRFGVVAANPALVSGIYGQWAWDNTDANPWWFANNGSTASGQRQWYATYFLGRVDLEGRFRPYHQYGYVFQGGESTQFNPDDLRHYLRCANLASQVRPEAACGFGLVLSWPWQERRMGPELGTQGFGLYTAKGQEQVDIRLANVYHKLVKNGLPVGFVTSTHGLRQWPGPQPLVAVDACNWEDEELATLARLNAAGTPIVAVGAPDEQPRPAAAAFFGLRREQGRLTALPDVRRLPLGDGLELLVRQARPGAAPIVCVPVDGGDLPGRQLRPLVAALLDLMGAPLQVPPGCAAVPFVSQGCLFLALLDQGDVSRQVAVSLRPEFFLPALARGKYRVLDLDEAVELPAVSSADGRVQVRLPMPASAGRLLLFAPAEE